jgi:hypothetical protein
VDINLFFIDSFDCFAEFLDNNDIKIGDHHFKHKVSLCMLRPRYCLYSLFVAYIIAVALNFLFHCNP